MEESEVFLVSQQGYKQGYNRGQTLHLFYFGRRCCDQTAVPIVILHVNHIEIETKLAP